MSFNGFLVPPRAVADVGVESVLGKDVMTTLHVAIAQHFGDDRRGGDARDGEVGFRHSGGALVVDEFEGAIDDN